MSNVMRKHRATGNPRGRPPRIPADLGRQILAALRRRVDPETGLVQPLWKQLAREFGVSRSTIARQMVVLHRLGVIERVVVPASPKISYIYYRVVGGAAGEARDTQAAGNLV